MKPMQYRCLRIQQNTAFLRKRAHVGTAAFKPPNQGLESSFCCWVSGQGSPKRNVFLADTGIIQRIPERKTYVRGGETRPYGAAQSEQAEQSHPGDVEHIPEDEGPLVCSVRLTRGRAHSAAALFPYM